MKANIKFAIAGALAFLAGFLSTRLPV